MAISTSLKSQNGKNDTFRSKNGLKLKFPKIARSDPYDVVHEGDSNGWPNFAPNRRLGVVYGCL